MGKHHFYALLHIHWTVKMHKSSNKTQNNLNIKLHLRFLDFNALHDMAHSKRIIDVKLYEFMTLWCY